MHCFLTSLGSKVCIRTPESAAYDFYLYNFNNQELQCYPFFYQFKTDLETLVRSATNKATNTELTQNSEFTQVLSTMLKQLHQTLDVDLRWVVL